jgi:hypothetical protein
VTSVFDAFRARDVQLTQCPEYLRTVGILLRVKDRAPDAGVQGGVEVFLT